MDRSRTENFHFGTKMRFRANCRAFGPRGLLSNSRDSLSHSPYVITIYPGHRGNTSRQVEGHRGNIEDVEHTRHRGNTSRQVEGHRGNIEDIEHPGHRGNPSRQVERYKRFLSVENNSCYSQMKIRNL